MVDIIWTMHLGLRKSRDAILSSLPPFMPDISIEEKWELTPLHETVLGLDTGNSVENLIKMSANVDAPDALAHTALWWAAWREDWTTVRTLLEHGANPNEANSEGVNPFLLATAKGPLDIVNKMLQAGASITAADNDGNTLLHQTANQREVVELLIGPNVDVNQENNFGATPLMTACKDDRDEVARCLIKHGADRNKPNPQTGLTPLLWSVRQNSHKTLRLLLDMHVSCQIADRWGKNLFMYACKYGSVETMNILSSYGVGRNFDPRAVDKAGRTTSRRIRDWIKTRSRFNALLRLFASSSCGDCTEEAVQGLLAANGGCPHGVLKELGLQDEIDALESELNMEEDCESDDNDWEHGLSEGAGEELFDEEELMDGSSEEGREQQQDSDNGQSERFDVDGSDSEEDEQFVDAVEWTPGLETL